MEKEQHLPPIGGARRGGALAPDLSHIRGSAVTRRTLQRSHQQHLERLNRVRPSIDNAPPKA